MNKDEIKQSVKMRDVVKMFGIHINRSNMCPCPFHRETKPSMKIYDNSFYCFGCGASGDVFEFVQRMNNCSFMSAFEFLGGEIESPSRKRDREIYEAKQKIAYKEKQKAKLQKKIQDNNRLITIYADWKKKVIPFSKEWCDLTNALEICLYRDEEYKKELNELNSC